MKLVTPEFEEPEFRGPLFNQLHSSPLVWEPGQVFEKQIGIDQAMWTANQYLHAVHEIRSPLPGVVLARLDLGYLMIDRKLPKKLPTFKLNVFIQAKRAAYGRRAPSALKAKGLGSPFWRFEITPHQQLALQRLQGKLGKRALVCYAAPVFHKEAVLHKLTVNRSIIEHSTFPDVSELIGHDAWNFSFPGAKGVANADPRTVVQPDLFERMRSMLQVASQFGDGGDNRSPVDELELLAEAAREAMDGQDGAALDRAARFRDLLQPLEDMLGGSRPFDSRSRAVLAFSTVALFVSLNRLEWLVLGEGEW